MDLKQYSWAVIEGIIAQVQDAVFIIKNERLIYVNGKLCELVNTPESELLSRSPFSFIHPDDRQEIEHRHARRTQGEEAKSEYTLRVISSNGDIKTTQVNVDVVADIDGVFLTIGSLKDITETIAYRKDLETSQKEILNILNNLPDIFYRTDAQGKVIYMSPSIKEALGYSPEEVYGREMSDLYVDPSDRERIVGALKQGNGVARHVEAWLRHKDGSSVWASTNAYICFDENGNPSGVEGISRNITDRKRLEERMEHLANHDSLTNLPSRRLLMHSLKQLAATSKRAGTKFGALFCDLDGFKAFNDNYSHKIGDQILIAAAEAMSSSIRSSDILGRLAGDEFLVIAPDLNSINDVKTLAEKLIQSIKNLQLPEGVNQELGISIGIAIYPTDTNDYDDLLSLADEAMYQAKSMGKNRFKLIQQ